MDNAWVLVSSALVLMMTGPGLALFYGGLVRGKNVLSTMMHSFAMMGIMVTVIWGIVGFSRSNLGAGDWIDCGAVLLPDGGQGQGEFRV